MALSQTEIPKTMRALQLVAFGDPEKAFKYIEAKVPEIRKPKQILVNVKAIGTNPVESMFRSGNGFIPIRLPAILGGDFAGVVVAKGSKVNEYNIGDRVYGSLHIPIGPNGTYAEYVLVTVGWDSVAKIPEHWSFIEAGSVGIAGLTAYKAIVQVGNISEKGGRVLVIGASGGVGTFAVQVAKAKGAHVVAICSGRNAELVTGLGADKVLDYTVPGAIEAFTKESLDTFDCIVDCVGGDDYYNSLLSILKKKGVYCTIVGPIEHISGATVRVFDLLKVGGILGWRALFAPRKYTMVLSLPHDKFATEISALMASSVKPVVSEDQVYDLKDGALAHQRLMTHRTRGKIVLRTSADVTL